MPQLMHSSFFATELLFDVIQFQLLTMLLHKPQTNKYKNDT